jgi:hypothetical protein
MTILRRVKCFFGFHGWTLPLDIDGWRCLHCRKTKTVKLPHNA